MSCCFERGNEFTFTRMGGSDAIEAARWWKDQSTALVDVVFTADDCDGADDFVIGQ